MSGFVSSTKRRGGCSGRKRKHGEIEAALSYRAIAWNSGSGKPAKEERTSVGKEYRRGGKPVWEFLRRSYR